MTPFKSDEQDIKIYTPAQRRDTAQLPETDLPQEQEETLSVWEPSGSAARLTDGI